MNKKREFTYLDHGLIKEDIDQEPLWVIPKDLCTRCGACHVICPTNVVEFDDSEFPFIRTKGCIDCGLCLKVCPGIEYDLEKYHQDIFRADYQNTKVGGYYQKAFVGYSKQADIHEEGSAGGVVTQILISLLRAKTIDGAVVVGSSLDDPTNAIPYIARSEEEIRAAAQSKYTVVANTRILREFRGKEEQFAFVGVGCQIQGLRKIQELNKRYRVRSYVTIGLACGGTLEKEAVRDLLALKGMELNGIGKVDHRGGAFPGHFRAVLKDGSIKYLHKPAFEYKDGAYLHLYRLYTPERCLICPDYAAEFADISASDIFLKGKDGQYLYPQGATLILCRTEIGVTVVEELIRSGDLLLEPVTPETVDRTYENHKLDRKIIPYILIKQLRRKGVRAPDYGVTIAYTLGQYLYSLFFRSTFIFSKSLYTRRIMLILLFSKFGDGITNLKMIAKKYRSRMKMRYSP